MSVNVNLSAKKQLSFFALKRKYPSTDSIIAEASLVSVYRYFKHRNRASSGSAKKTKALSSSDKYWSKESVTGPLFVVQHQNASVGVIILNQEGTCRLLLLFLYMSCRQHRAQ